ncbi:MAG: TonB family protein [Bacteroidetes bacterium]|jgi:protein TonB|nr:TonB family protein [Bacteroidota bacterium]
MKQYFFTIFLLCIGFLGVGQTDTVIQNQESAPKNKTIQIMPKFPGGEQAIYKIVSDSMVYPKLAAKERIGGRIIIQFTVDTMGNIADVKIMRGIREDLDKEAIRLIYLLNGWTPGTENGKKVRVSFNLPLYFYPDEKFRKKYKKENSIK